jgi:hypothetical protein
MHLHQLLNSLHKDKKIMVDFNEPSTPIDSTAPNGEIQPVEEKKSERFSSAFSKLARKEQALRKEKESFLKEREESSHLKEKITAWERAKSNAKLDPKSALEQLGLNFEEIQEYFLNGAQPSANTLVEQLRRELEETKSQFQKQLEEKEQQQTQAQIERQEREFKFSIQSEIEKSEAEFLKASDEPQETVYRLIQGWYDKNGEVLPTKDAIELIEKELEQDFQKRFGKLNKVTSLFKAHLGEPMQAPAFRSIPQGPIGNSGVDRRMSEQERVAAAARLMASS